MSNSDTLLSKLSPIKYIEQYNAIGTIQFKFRLTGNKMIFENYGYCYCCDNNTKFSAKYDWFRDHYICTRCGSIPRERALIYCIEKFVTDWKEKKYMNLHQEIEVLQ